MGLLLICFAFLWVFFFFFCFLWKCFGFRPTHTPFPLVVTETISAGGGTCFTAGGDCHIRVNVNTNSSGCRFLQIIIPYRLMTGRFPFPPFCRTFGVKYLPNLARKAFKLALKYEELLRWGQTHHCTARQDHSVTFNQSFSSNS